MKQQINKKSTFLVTNWGPLGVLPRWNRNRAHTSARISAIQAINLEAAYIDHHAHLDEFQGPVQVLDLPGRGRGIVASAALSPGQVVMISKPLAFLTCPMGGIPSLEELTNTIQSTTYSSEDRQALLSLYSGEDDPLDHDDDGNQQLNEERLFGIIGCNSFGEEASDLPTAYCRVARARNKDCDNDPSRGNGGSGNRNGNTCISIQPQPVGHLGLFPSFSMLNHSCTPNAVNFVAGEAMCVMAARAIPQGSEVTINYLGRAALRPVAERQALLAEAYHFACDCPRCRAELLCDCGGSGGGGGGAGRWGGRGGVGGGGGGGQAGPLMGTGAPVAIDGLVISGTFGEAVQELLARCELREHTLAQNMRSSQPPPAGASAVEAIITADGGATNQAIDCAGQPSNIGDCAPPSSTEFDILLAEVRRDVATLDELIRQASAAASSNAAAVMSSPCRAGDKGDGRMMGALSEPSSTELPIWLAASAFDLLSQYAALAEAARRPEEAAEAVGRQLAVCQEAAPGSDLHLYLAVKALGLSQAAGEAAAAAAVGGGYGGSDAGAVEAAAMARCRDAVRRRYGSELSEETVGLLLRGAAWGLSQVVV